MQPGYLVDDFDLDDGLDLEQFEYHPNSQLDHKSIYADDNEVFLAAPPYDEFADPNERRYVTKIDDNIILQSKPIYEVKYLQSTNKAPHKDHGEHNRHISINSYTTERYTGNEHEYATPRERYEREYADYRRNESRNRQRNDFRRSHSKSSSRPKSRRGAVPLGQEKVRRFPPPDPKMPHIPLPDYDGASEVQYVPDPDY